MNPSRRASGRESLERIAVLVRKELRQVFRDPRLVRVILVSPMVQLVVPCPAGRMIAETSSTTHFQSAVICPIARWMAAGFSIKSSARRSRPRIALKASTPVCRSG